ncbi:EamA family transporter [Planotetraspora sp. A-T 1434]|uniref:EamA family transporter n=1 Tax=Planotetraspora sp. A-T 1434 TaxID=2979219 RepID=UPI0021C22F55|nr:EamA family transporter [Planotetraspora sp. A-T 1434]MCT9931032.1 EamA family transporter [Planotetraspora sp. A-T 1434]
MTHASALPVRRGLVHLSIAAAAWGTGGAAGALLHRTGDLSPVAVSFWRFACGAAFLLIAARVGRRPASRPSWRTIAVIGPAMAVCQAAYFAAIADTGVAVATMVTMGANPVLVAVGGRVFLREPFSRTRLACVGLAVAGLAMLVGGAGRFTPAGVGYALLSAAGYSAVTLFARSAGDDRGRALWGFVAGAVCLLPLAAAHGLFPAPGDAGATVLLLAYLGAVPTALAYGLFFAGLRTVSGTTAAVIALLEPLVAAAIGVFLLREHLAAAQLAGGITLLAAVACLARSELNAAG